MRFAFGVQCATQFIAAYAGSTGAIGRFVINLSKNVSQWPQSEFGVGSRPAGRRLRPQIRGLRSEALAGSVAGCLGLFAGVGA